MRNGGLAPSEASPASIARAKPALERGASTAWRHATTLRYSIAEITAVQISLGARRGRGDLLGFWTGSVVERDQASVPAVRISQRPAPPAGARRGAAERCRAAPTTPRDRDA